MEIELAVLIVLLTLSGIFSASEAALLTIGRIRLKYIHKTRGRIASVQSLTRLKGDMDSTLMTILIGNNVVNITGAFLASHITIVYFGEIYLGVATGVLTLAVLIFSEIIPKNWATKNADVFGLLVARPLEILSKILRPVIWFLRQVSNFVPGAPGHKKLHLSEDELRGIFELGVEDRTISVDEKRFFERILDFNDTYVKEIMTPREEVKYLKTGQSYDEMMHACSRYKKNRYPVLDKDEKVVGMVTVKKILAHPKQAIEKIMVKPYFVSKEMTAFDLFSKMQKSRIQMAIVLDPDGELDGVVTLEDLVEEIVGEIEDEGTRVSPPIAKSELVVSGDTRLHDVEKELGESLVGSERFGSVASYIHYQLRRLPIKGDVIITGRTKIEVKEISDNHKMHKIIIKRI